MGLDRHVIALERARASTSSGASFHQFKNTFGALWRERVAAGMM